MKLLGLGGLLRGQAGFVESLLDKASSATIAPTDKVLVASICLFFHPPCPPSQTCLRSV